MQKQSKKLALGGKAKVYKFVRIKYGIISAKKNAETEQKACTWRESKSV